MVKYGQTPFTKRFAKERVWGDLCKWNLVGVSKNQMNSVDSL